MIRQLNAQKFNALLFLVFCFSLCQLPAFSQVNPLSNSPESTTIALLKAFNAYGSNPNPATLQALTVAAQNRMSTEVTLVDTPEGNAQLFSMFLNATKLNAFPQPIKPFLEGAPTPITGQLQIFHAHTANGIVNTPYVRSQVNGKEVDYILHFAKPGLPFIAAGVPTMVTVYGYSLPQASNTQALTNASLLNLRRQGNTFVHLLVYSPLSFNSETDTGIKYQ